MIRWICHVKPDQTQYVRSETLLDTLSIQPLDVILRANRLRWFGHIERSSGPINTCRDLKVASQKKAERPEKTWRETIRHDHIQWQMVKVDPHDHDHWRRCIKTVRQRRTPDEGNTDAKLGYWVSEWVPDKSYAPNRSLSQSDTNQICFKELLYLIN